MTQERRHQPTRWTTEQEVLAELERLNDLSETTSQAYHNLATEAAEREATHKALRAQRALLAKASGARVSVQVAEWTAEADPEVAEAYMLRLTSAAVADSCREALRSIRTNQEALRTAIASLRTPFAAPGAH